MQFFSGYSQSQSLYPIKSCKIEFTFSTGLQKGIRTVIFDDSGRSEKVVESIYVDTCPNSEIPKGFVGKRTLYHTLGIRTENLTLNADLDSLIGSSMGGYIPTYNQSTCSSGINDMEEVGNEIILGKKCLIFDYHGARIWCWKGLTLKKELLSGGFFEIATSMEENYSIKADEFEIPKNIKLK